MTTAEIVALVDATFTAPHPGDAFLQGTFEGCEPFDEVGAFTGVADWRELAPEFLDGHYAVLSFFSEAGLRFFLPAYLVADLRDALAIADPLFGLVHGFSEMAFARPEEGVVHRSGGPVLLDPIRYGAMTWEDASRQRLSVFCREEAAVIVAYLRWRRTRDPHDLDTPRIDAALERFWLPRAASAPTRADLDAFGR